MDGAMLGAALLVRASQRGRLLRAAVFATGITAMDVRVAALRRHVVLHPGSQAVH
jgi:hypothetical protein